MFQAIMNDDFPTSHDYIKYQQDQRKEDIEDLKYSHEAIKYGDDIFGAIMRLPIDNKIKDRIYKDRADGGYYNNFHFYKRKDKYRLSDLIVVVDFYKEKEAN